MSLELLMVAVAVGVPLVLYGATKLAQRSKSEGRSAAIGTIAFIAVGLLIVIVLASA